MAIIFETPLPPLLPFVPLFRGGDNEVVVRRALSDLRADERLSEPESLLAFFASFVLQTELVQQIMRWDMAVLTQSPFYQEIVAHKAQEDVLENLDAHFGHVPKEAAEKVQAVSDLERLKVLHRRAITASTMDEFLQELDAAAEGQA